MYYRAGAYLTRIIGLGPEFAFALLLVVVAVVVVMVVVVISLE